MKHKTLHPNIPSPKDQYRQPTFIPKSISRLIIIKIDSSILHAPLDSQRHDIFPLLPYPKIVLLVVSQQYTKKKTLNEEQKIYITLQ